MLRISLIGSVALCLALAQGAVLPTFVFPEEEDDYFAQNIELIKTDIGQALDNGCLDAWPLEDQTEIAVVFRHDSMVPETSDFYIQYQMEQVAADAAQDSAVGFRSLADHVQYKRKLAGALQVWEWSPHQMDFLKDALPGNVAKKLAYVPLSASTEATDGCDAVLDEEWCKEDGPVDVLFFGSMTESRKRLCNMVDEELDRLKIGGKTFAHQCVSGTFGDALKCKVCKAKVIYSDHSRKGASLEVHRINPLLAQGKAVVSAKSADKFLDSLYQGAIELVDTEAIPKAISKLLLDDVRRMKLEWRSYALSQQLKRKAQSVLCQAFRSMATLASESSSSPDSWKREGLQDYVPYLADRRLQTGNGSNATNGTVTPTPMPTPMPAPMPTPTPPTPPTPPPPPPPPTPPTNAGLTKLKAAGSAALVASEDICVDSATVPAFNAAVASLVNVPTGAVDSSCSSTASNSSGGRRLSTLYNINMTYAVELIVDASDANQISIDLVNILKAMSASDLQTALDQQLASVNKSFNVTVTAHTPPDTVTATPVIWSNDKIVSFLSTTTTTTTTTAPPSPTPSPVPSPTPAPTPTPVPTPTPSPTPPPTPTPSAPPSPTPSPTPTDVPSPTPSPTDSSDPTPTPAPTDVPSPTPSPTPTTTPLAPVDEEESGSMRMCQVFTGSVAMILASLLF